MGLDDGFRLFALLNGIGKRLLAEDMLARFHGDFDHLYMRSRIGDDGHRFHFRIFAHGLGIGINGAYAQLFRDFLRSLFVAVADRDQLRTRNAARQIARMLIAKSSDADDAEFDFLHDDFLLFIKAPCTF